MLDSISLYRVLREIKISWCELKDYHWGILVTQKTPSACLEPAAYTPGPGLTPSSTSLPPSSIFPPWVPLDLYSGWVLSGESWPHVQADPLPATVASVWGPATPPTTTTISCDRFYPLPRQFPGGSAGKESACPMQERWVRSLGGKDPLEKGMATHSSILAWKIHGQRSPMGYSP